MEKKLNAIRVHLKDGTNINLNVDGTIIFRQVGEFMHLDNDGKKLVSIATSEISYIKYFYSELENKQ